MPEFVENTPDLSTATGAPHRHRTKDVANASGSHRPRRALAQIDVNAGDSVSYVPKHSRALLVEKPQRLEGASSGQKRKLRVDPVQEGNVSAEQEERLKMENIAWLDMLLYLLERKYGRYAMPVSLEMLERAARYEQLYGASKNKTPVHIEQQPSERKAVTDEVERDKRRQRMLRRHALQIQETSGQSTTSCGCKTGCLKMYCVCFSSRGFCHPECSCEDCKNSRENKDQRVEAIQSYLANDLRAFSFASKAQAQSSNGFVHLLPQKSSTVVLRGCRCKKSKCLKKYCECFQNGIACTSHCRCVDCANHSHDAPPSRPKAATEVKQTAGFHVEVSVTKKPRRNHIQRTMRLRL